jgi:hypothetical protein
MSNDQIVRQQLLNLLRGGNAHMDLDDAVADFPQEFFNRRAPNVDYTPWHLLEHIRLAQLDILEFIRDPDYESPEWPAGFWPPKDQQADAEDWQRTIDQFQVDRKALQEIAADPETDLYAPLPAGDEYNILREILITADHSAYHIGEFGLLRGVMGTWSQD